MLQQLTNYPTHKPHTHRKSRGEVNLKFIKNQK